MTRLVTKSLSFNCIVDYTAPHYCKNYSLLTGVDRAQGYYNPFVSLTDAGLTPGWYRFSGGAGK